MCNTDPNHFEDRPLDTDGDGICDYLDADTDGDGETDEREQRCGSDPLMPKASRPMRTRTASAMRRRKTGTTTATRLPRCVPRRRLGEQGHRRRRYAGR